MPNPKYIKLPYHDVIYDMLPKKSTEEYPYLEDGNHFGNIPDEHLVEIDEEDLTRQIIEDNVIYHSDTPGKYNIKTDYEKYPFDNIHTPLRLEDKKRLLKGFKYLPGGVSNLQSRRNYYKQVPELRHVIDSLSKVYNINPKLMANRVAHEGLLDFYAHQYNYNTTKKDQKTVI